MSDVITARHREWGIEESGASLEEIASKIGDDVKHLEITRVETRDQHALRDVPKEFHSVLYDMAYERGHSAGEDEVSAILEGLIADLAPAIEKFEKRIRSDK